MKAHTAEHMLFQALSRVFAGIRPEKVSLEPNAFSLFVGHAGPLDWDGVLSAVKMVNQVIRDARPVSVKVVRKSEVPADVRIKMERIEEDEVRIVEVEGFDKVACSGLHVKNTNELGAFCVSRITSEKPGIWKVDFLHGDEAVDFLLSSSKVALSSSQILGTGIDRLERTVANLLAEEEKRRREAKELAELALAGLKSEEHNGLNLYVRTFSYLDQKLLQEWAGRLAKRGRTVVVFAVKSDESASIVAGRSKDLVLDMRKIGGEALRLMGGKGGGSESFICGSGAPEKLDEAIRFIVSNAKR
jgi:alanyl-tRNA synthetase